MKIDGRLETLCDQFTELEEPEKDYILGISQTLAQSMKGTKPVPIVELTWALPKYQDLIKENLA